MEKNEQFFYKYIVTFCEIINDEPKLRTVSGLTFGANFNEACEKITDYFGENVIEELKIEFVSDCDMLEEDEVLELFNTKSETTNEVFNEIKKGLSEAIEYEKGSLELRSSTVSKPDKK